MLVREYQTVDGIKIFDNQIANNHQDYNAKGLDKLYDQEEKHFWFITRKEFIYKKMDKYIAKFSEIIEIGAGTGNVSRYLQQNGYKNICVGEMHLNGLKYAKSYGIKECYQFDLLEVPFVDEFDTVCMFDVLEHIENDVLALQNVRQMLKTNGKIVITVPAHMWLWNKDDVTAGHKIRYTKNKLKTKLEENGFTIEISRYFFIAILPLLFLRTLINKDHNYVVSNEKNSQEMSIHPILNFILLVISRLENRLNKILPNLFGGSLFIIARKK